MAMAQLLQPWADEMCVFSTLVELTLPIPICERMRAARRCFLMPPPSER
jgi:hypothetical protein